MANSLTQKLKLKLILVVLIEIRPGHRKGEDRDDQIHDHLERLSFSQNTDIGQSLRNYQMSKSLLSVLRVPPYVSTFYDLLYFLCGMPSGKSNSSRR